MRLRFGHVVHITFAWICTDSSVTGSQPNRVDGLFAVFSGPIPSALGELTALEYLDLGSNGLCGEERMLKATYREVVVL